MSRPRQLLILLLSLCTTAALLAGCQGLNQKAHNTGNFIAGNTEEVLQKTPAEVADAARQASDDAKLVFIGSEDKPIEDKAGKRTQTVFTTRSKSDDKITFTITPQENGTLLQVNSGFLGDTEMRHRLIDAVKKHLGIDPMQAAPPATQLVQ